MALQAKKKFTMLLTVMCVVGVFIGYSHLQNYQFVSKVHETLREAYPKVSSLVRLFAAEDPVFVLFSSWVSSEHKRHIYDNTLRMWRTWQPHIVPLLYSDDEEERKRAESFGWQAMAYPNTTCGGVPILREMYRAAFDLNPNTPFVGFCNGDLLLGAGLLETMQVLSRTPISSEGPALIILRRINVNFVNRSEIRSIEEVAPLQKEGRPVTDGSSDAFFVNRHFPLHRLPDIVIGRLGVAMITVAAARTLNVTVIDVSPTVIAIHMTSNKGNAEGYAYKTAYCNRQLVERLGMKPSDWMCGAVMCASWTTVKEGNATTRVEPKQKALPRCCHNCTMNMSAYP